MKSFILITTLILFLGLAPPGHTANNIGEYQVKTAYLYNFIKFIHWPTKTFEDESSPLIIGLLGENYFGDNLDSLQGKKIGQRSIRIKYFATLDDIRSCHMLYISKSENSEIKKIVKKLSMQPTVTVGEYEEFVDQGGVIQFITKRGRLRFLINQKVAQNNRIQIDAQLLSLAIKVIEVEK